MKKIKVVVLNSIIVFCFCIFILLMLEISAKIFFPANKPKVIEKKNSRILVYSEYQMEIKTNSEGFRDIERELNKPKDVFRILVVGDSFTFGWGVEAKQTYSSVLQKLLNEKIPAKKFKYEVFNMGLHNIGTLEELEIIKNGLKYKPDLILLGLLAENRWYPANGNDLCDNFRSSSKFKNRTSIDYLNSFHRFLSKNSALYFFVMDKKGQILRRRLIALREGQNQPQIDAAWHITKSALIKINSIAKKAGAEFVIIRIPFLYDVYREDKDRVKSIMEEFGKKNKINICDLLTVLRKNKDSDLYYPIDGHWRPQAHSIAAQEIFDYLINKNLIVVE